MANGINFHDFIDESKCYEFTREKRWKDGVYCPKCTSFDIIRCGYVHKNRDCHRYKCRSCKVRFNDLTGTVFANRRKTFSSWIGVLYLMGLNISNRQIAQELQLHTSQVQEMAEVLRKGINEKKVHYA